MHKALNKYFTHTQKSQWPIHSTVYSTSLVSGKCNLKPQRDSNTYPKIC